MARPRRRQQGTVLCSWLRGGEIWSVNVSFECVIQPKALLGVVDMALLKQATSSLCLTLRFGFERGHIVIPPRV